MRTVAESTGARGFGILGVPYWGPGYKEIRLFGEGSPIFVNPHVNVRAYPERRRQEGLDFSAFRGVSGAFGIFPSPKNASV